MDFGGHDSAFTDNIIYVGGDGLDGQNCFNAGGMLAGHGTVWARNKCVLQHSKVVGEVSTCDCPGGASGGASGGAWAAASRTGSRTFPCWSTARARRKYRILQLQTDGKNRGREKR